MQSPSGLQHGFAHIVSADLQSSLSGWTGQLFSNSADFQTYKEIKEKIQTAQSLPLPLSGQQPGLTGGGLPRLWSTGLVLQTLLSMRVPQLQLLPPWLSE